METAALPHFERPRHRAIARLLNAFDPGRLLEAGCYFGGGTSIVMQLGEYREAVGVDFHCSSVSGYRSLRNIVGRGIEGLLKVPVKHLREVKSDQYKILTFVEIDGVPIKIEFLHEGNTQLSGALDLDLGVPVLSRVDMWAQKLMANADRALDKSTASRDILDLAMMLTGWGALPEEAFAKAYAPYGPMLVRNFHRATRVIFDPELRRAAMDRLGMNRALEDSLVVCLDDAAAALPLSDEEQIERARRIDAGLGSGSIGRSEGAEGHRSQDEGQRLWSRIVGDELGACRARNRRPVHR